MTGSRIGRRHLLQATAAAALLGHAAGRPVAAQAAAGALPVPPSLPDAVARALERGRALVLMVDLHGCPYCKIVREGYLLPLLQDGQPVAQIGMGLAQPLVDFDGSRSTHRAVVARLGVRTAPTVLLVGRGGRELVPRLVGMSIPDFYGAYLQDRVREANRLAV